MNAASHHTAHRIAGPIPGYSRVRVGFEANDDCPAALHKLTGSLLWGLLLLLVCLGSASSEANNPPGQLVASFVYNPSGLRIEKQGERGVERFTYDEQSLLQAYDENNTTLAKYDYGAERLVSLTSSSEPVQFYLTDALNSVVNLTNTAGSVQARYQYDAFGNQRAQSGSSYNRFAFTGYVEDKETDLLYAKARYYDSDTGRFLSQDAWEGQNDLPPSLHKYLYAYQNSTVYVDPDGNVVLPALAAYFLYTAVQTAFDVGVDRGIAELTNDEEFSYTKSIATNFGINAATAGVGGKLKNAGKVGKLAAETAIDAGVTTAYEVGAEGKDAGSTLVENTASGIAGRIVGDKIAKRFSGSSHVDSTAEPSLKTAQPNSEAIVTRESDTGPLTRNEESVRVGDVSVQNEAGYLYRGVHAGHPAMEDALVGRVVPGNINGTVSPEAHNLDALNVANSPYTSWTLNYSIAVTNAQKAGSGGVILKAPIGAPPPDSTWSWEYSIDEWGESERLLRGVRENLEVVKP